MKQLPVLTSHRVYGPLAVTAPSTDTDDATAHTILYRTQLTVSCLLSIYSHNLISRKTPGPQLSVHHAAHSTWHPDVGGGPLQVCQGSLTSAHIISVNIQ